MEYRNKEIVRMRNRGETYRSIGNMFGITKVRAGQIYASFYKKQKEEKELKELWGYNFGKRTLNCLRTIKIKTPKDLLDKIKTYHDLVKLLNIRNFGMRCFKEVENYLIVERKLIESGS